MLVRACGRLVIPGVAFHQVVRLNEQREHLVDLKHRFSHPGPGDPNPPIQRGFAWFSQVRCNMPYGNSSWFAGLVVSRSTFSGSH